VDICWAGVQKIWGKKIETFKIGGGKKSTPWPEYIPLSENEKNRFLKSELEQSTTRNLLIKF